MGNFSKISIDGIEYNIEDNRTLATLVALLTNSNVVEVDNTSNWDTDNIYIYRGTTSGSFINSHVYIYNDQWVDIGKYSREGLYTEASGIYSHAEGNRTLASGEASHTEGRYTSAPGENSHAEGYNTEASGEDSHTEGYYTRAQGEASHAEGNYTRAVGDFSHAEGTEAYAMGHSSHAGGFYTKATRKAQTVIGRYNEEDTQDADGTEYGKYAFIIGNGTDSNNRSNAFMVDWDGNIECGQINGMNIGDVNDNAVTTEKIANFAVTYKKLADEAVIESKIKAKAVTSEKIANGAVHTRHLASKILTGEYDSMTVGTAKQLLSDTYVENKVPYIFRTSGGSLEIGDREEDTLVGMDLVWNQLVTNIQTYTRTQSGVTATIQNNKLTLSGTATDTGYLDLIEAWRFKIYKDRVYFVQTPNMSGKSGFFQTPYASLGTQRGAKIAKNTATQTAYYQVYVVNGENYDGIEGTCQIIDLTTMFGSTIADYIYSLETSTAGAGVAWVKRYLTKDYYPYSAPTMQNGVASSHDTVGFNQWNEEWENGRINVNTGSDASGNGVRSKNYIRILPNTAYHAVRGDYTGGETFTLFYYDADKNYIGYDNIAGVSVNFTTPANAYYMRFNIMTSAAITTYNHDICINFHYDGERDGEYEPYVKHSYPLDDTVDLHGIPKIDASGNLYADGDTYEADGTVTRKYGVVDLGDLNWSYASAATSYPYGFFYAIVPGRKYGVDNIICSAYPLPPSQTFEFDKTILGNSGGTNVYVIDSAYLDAATFKTAMSGVMLVYELATPTTETAEPFQTPQIVDNWGTEEYVSEGVIPIGHTTKYPVNLRSKIEVEPNSPTSDGVYLMQRENGVNTYVPFVKELPTLPSENGTYSLKCTVSGSTKTLSWASD